MKFGIRSIAATSALGLAGMGLIGVGAHAVWTLNSTSAQQITSGDPSVAMTGSAGSDCTLVTQACTTVNLPGVGPTNSTFDVGPFTATATNTGNVTLSELDLDATVTYPTSALAEETYVCLGSTGIGTGGTFFSIYFGTLAGLNGATYSQGSDTLTVKGTTPTSTSAPTDNWIVYYATGPSQSTPCGSTPGGDTGLGNGAENQSINLSLTMSYSG